MHSRRYMHIVNEPYLDSFGPWVVRMMQYAESRVLESKRKCKPLGDSSLVRIMRNNEIMFYDLCKERLMCLPYDCVWTGCIVEDGIRLKDPYDHTVYTISSQGELQIFRPKTYSRVPIPLALDIHASDCCHTRDGLREFYFTDDLHVQFYHGLLAR
jgi:hypothetical protein